MKPPKAVKGKLGEMNHRHGDVGLVAVKPPGRTGRQRLDHLRVAEGEVTGHAHRIVSASSLFRQDDKGCWFLAEEVGAPKAELYMHDGNMYVRASEEIALVHEDHSAILLSPGTYLYEAQREWSPLGEQKVYD